MRNSLLLILCCAFYLFQSQSFAQPEGRLRGFVTDAATGEVLPFCNVFINELGSGSSTDQRGFYFINKIPANRTYTIEFSYVGYKSKTLEVHISPGKITELNIELDPSATELQTVEKIEKRISQRELMDLGVERLTLRELESLPQTVEADIMRSLKFIPGVTSTGDISAKYYVRGGTGDQNLVLLNGITLYNPFHALGLFSVIDAEMVNSIEFYKGGFSSEYGGRVSSVMNVMTKDGNKNNYSATASISLLTAKALVEGPMEYGSFIFTGRRSYSTSILNKFLTQEDVPIDFYDFSFKVNYSNAEFLENGKFTLFGFFSGDKLDDPKPLSDDFKWSNDLFGIEWMQIYDAPLFSRFQFGYSHFNGEVIPHGTAVKPRNNSVHDYTFQSEFVYVWKNKDQVSLGLDFKAVNTELIQENDRGSVLQVDDFSGNYIFFTKYQLHQIDNFGIDAGARLYFTGLTNKGGFSIEPRINGFWAPFPALSIKASAGTYRQEIATVTDENEVISLFDPWTIYPDYLEPTRSLNLSLGADYFFTPQIKYTLEVYYKDIHNLVAVNDQKIFDDDPALINGSGRAHGIEQVLVYEFRRIRVNASYALSWAYKTVREVEFHPKYDTRHNLNFGISYILGDGWKFGLIWSFNSGFPFTPMRGYYDKFEFTNFFENLPASDEYSIYTLLGQKNIKRLPEYHRLDLTFSKSFELDFMDIEINASIINLYDRKNIFYFKRDTGEKVYMLPFLPTASVKVKI